MTPVARAARLMREHDNGDVLVTYATISSVLTDCDVAIRAVAEIRAPHPSERYARALPW